VLQCAAVCGGMLQCSQQSGQYTIYYSKYCVCCRVLQCVAVYCRVLQGVAVCCSVLQCVAGCCRVLQCVVGLRVVAKSCSELQ